MATVIKTLERLNLKIAEAEGNCRWEKVKACLAPKFAFLRANGTFEDREQFVARIGQIMEKSPRTTTIESITVHANRAVVSCIVTMDGKRYHNLRLFVKSKRKWKLLGWANEEIPYK